MNKKSKNFDAVQNFIENKQKNCKHEKGFRTNTGSDESKCIECGMGWMQILYLQNLAERREQEQRENENKDDHTK